MKNNFTDALNKLSAKDTGTLEEVKAPRYKTSKQISVYLSQDSLDKIKQRGLNRTQVINDAVAEYLKGLSC